MKTTPEDRRAIFSPSHGSVGATHLADIRKRREEQDEGCRQILADFAERQRRHGL